MVNYWVFDSDNITYAVGRGMEGVWYITHLTANRTRWSVRADDRAIIYQPKKESLNRSRKGAQCFVGHFVVDSAIYYEKRTDDVALLNIREFNLWKPPVKLADLLGRLKDITKMNDPKLHRVIFRIEYEDYLAIIEEYAKSVEVSY